MGWGVEGAVGENIFLAKRFKSGKQSRTSCLCPGGGLSLGIANQLPFASAAIGLQNKDLCLSENLFF